MRKPCSQVWISFYAWLNNFGLKIKNLWTQLGFWFKFQIFFIIQPNFWRKFDKNWGKWAFFSTFSARTLTVDPLRDPPTPPGPNCAVFQTFSARPPPPSRSTFTFAKCVPFFALIRSFWVPQSNCSMLLSSPPFWRTSLLHKELRWSLSHTDPIMIN